MVCLFQVFDHIPDPNLLLRECRRILRPGGLVLALNHNVDALPNRILGARSPIIDVEHTYLYSPATMNAIFRGQRLRRPRDRPGLERLQSPLPCAPCPDPTPAKGVAPEGSVVVDRPRHGARALGNLFLIARSPATKSEPS